MRDKVAKSILISHKKHIETQHPEDQHTRGQKEVPPRAVSEAERMGKDHDGGDALRPSSSARSAERKQQQKEQQRDQEQQEQQQSRPRSKGSKGSRKTSSGASSRSKPSSSSSSSSRASRRISPSGSGGGGSNTGGGSGGDGGAGGGSGAGNSSHNHPGLLEVWKSIFRGHHSRHGGAGGEKRSGPRRTRHKSKNPTPATDGAGGDGGGDVGSKDQAVPSARLGVSFGPLFSCL